MSKEILKAKSMLSNIPDSQYGKLAKFLETNG